MARLELYYISAPADLRAGLAPQESGILARCSLLLTSQMRHFIALDRLQVRQYL